MNIPTQLSRSDCELLNQVRDLVARHKPYVYLEIGSYLGGSLHPHLSDTRCVAAWSVDTRATVPIRDERDIDYAYTVSTADMVQVLRDNNINIQRLHTIDGTVADVPGIQADIVFIDGEHTNVAALNDAQNSLRFQPQVIMFHDDWIVRQAITDFVQSLADANIPALVHKFPTTDITAVVFGDLQSRFRTFAESNSL